MSALFLGIDVGTGSARAGVFDERGTMLGTASRVIAMNRPAADFVEQSSANIWTSVCQAVAEAMRLANADAKQVRGIGFDATCSLVAVDGTGAPVTVSPTGDDAWNVIVWMDHRAIAQADAINALGHDVLRYVGGVISPEMQTPKLLWLKKNLPATWQRAAHFFDLPDFLVWRATGSPVRSLCTTVCKWTYLGHESAAGTWDATFFQAAGLADLAENNWARIGNDVRPMGEPVARGLTPEAAQELGLEAGTPVGVSIIDAHAGGLGVIGARIDNEPLTAESASRRLALIGGTSSCHMAVSLEARFVDGIWGPYYSAMVPGYWLNEGGQSATGALIDHVIHSHSAAADLSAQAEARNCTIYEILNDLITTIARDRGVPVCELTRELHVLPYFHGNRSPRANPSLRGMVSGLKLSATAEDLALLYLATIQAIAHGTRHIIDELNASGYAIDTICACGGGTKNPVYLQQHADITGCRIILSAEPEAVLLGSAILGAVASGDFPTIETAMAAMSRAGRTIMPNREEKSYHDRKHRIFHRMYDDQIAYRELMRG